MGEYILTKSLLLFLHIEYILSLQNLDFRLWLKLAVLRTGIILFRYSIGKDNCAIKGCPNTAGQIRRLGKAVNPHPLWKSKVIRAAWLRAISNENCKLSKCTQLCYDHIPGGIGRNWKYTVPVIHLRQNKNIHDVSRKIRKIKCTTDNDIFYWTDHSEDACHSQILGGPMALEVFTRKLWFWN